MKTLLIKQIASLVSCDDEDRVYENVDLYAVSYTHLTLPTSDLV